MSDENLITWLRGHFDEDERVAREASGDRWVTGRSMGYEFSGPGDVYAVAPGLGSARIAQGTACGPEISAAQSSDHIARQNPARVLAEVAAKRRLLDLHQHQRFVEPTDSRPNAHPDDRREAFAEDPRYVGCRRCHFDYRDEEVHPYFWCETVRLLARPYADHPGYRDDWRPDEA